MGKHRPYAPHVSHCPIFLSSALAASHLLPCQSRLHALAANRFRSRAPVDGRVSGRQAEPAQSRAASTTCVRHRHLVEPVVSRHGTWTLCTWVDCRPATAAAAAARRVDTSTSRRTLALDIRAQRMRALAADDPLPMRSCPCSAYVAPPLRLDRCHSSLRPTAAAPARAYDRSRDSFAYTWSKRQSAQVLARRVTCNKGRRVGELSLRMREGRGGTTVGWWIAVGAVALSGLLLKA